jgi:hypothetical protein
MAGMSQTRYLSLGCIVKDEDDAIEEWVAFHLAVGVDHIVVIDNGPSRDLPTILWPYLKAGRVELYRFTSRGEQQQQAYERLIRKMAGKTRWLGLIDVDEFLFPSREDSLKDVLSQFEDVAGVAVNWVSYGSSGHDIPPAGFVIDDFTDRGPLNHRFPWPRLRQHHLPEDHPEAYLPMNTHVKTVLDPARVKGFRTAHHYSFLPGEVCVTENREEISSPVSTTVSIEKLRINHYWSKSVADIHRKVDKGRVASDSRKNPSKYSLDVALARDAAASGEVDLAATRFSQATRDTISHYRTLAAGEKPPSTPPPRLRYQPGDWIRATRRRLWRRVRKVIRLIQG